MPKRLFRISRLPLMLSALSLFLGCTTAKMATELRNTATEMKVEGLVKSQFNGHLKFGPYEVTDLKRGWTSKFGWGIIIFESSKAKQRYQFTLTRADGKPWDCDCATGVDRKSLHFENFLDTGGELIADLKGNTLFTCVFRREGDEKIWRLAMSMQFDQPVMNGFLTDQKTVIRVEGSQKLEGTPITSFEATGYEFVLDGTNVCAVETMNDGMVWMKDKIDPDTREALAAASAALLLYREIGK